MSIFPTKILLATDGSKDANLAARTAVDLADKTGSELHVAFVLRTQDAPYYDTTGFDTEKPYEEEEIKQMGQRLLDEQVRRVEEAGGTVAGAHFRMARPDRGILAVGEDIGAGLIVLGSRGLGGVKRALMGSVSDSVVMHAHCPVLVVRKADDPDQEETDQEMLLAWDMGEDAQKKAEYAIKQVDERYYPVIIDREAGGHYEIENPLTGGILSYSNPQAAETYIKHARKKEQG